jgi:hypothetical protein
LRNNTIADNRRRNNPEFIGTNSENSKKAAQVRSDQYYFKRGLCYSQYGERSPQYWFSHGGIFSKEACLIIPNNDKLELNTVLGYLSSHVSRFFVKAFFGNMSKTPVGALQNSPFPIDIQIESELLEKLILEVEENGIISENNELWQNISRNIAFQMGMDSDMILEIFVWLRRTFMRPGGEWQ